MTWWDRYWRSPTQHEMQTWPLFASDKRHPRSAGVLLVSALVPVALFLNGFFMPNLDSPWLQWGTDLASYVVLPLCTFLWLRTHAGIAPLNYGVVSLKQAGQLGSVLKETALALVVLLVITQSVPGIAWSVLWRAGLAQYAFTQPEHIHLPAGGLGRFAAVGYLCVSAAVVEEVFFRGLLRYFMLDHRTHPSKLRSTWYVLASSMLFGFCHWERGAAIVFTMFFFGIAASMLYLRFSSLYPLVGAHALVGVVVRWSY
jgi:membrane protease YdiL (CAAX protease family)